MVGTNAYLTTDWNSKLFEISIVFVHSATWGVLLLLLLSMFSVFSLGLDVRFACDYCWLPPLTTQPSKPAQRQPKIYMHLFFCHFVSIYLLIVLSFFSLFALLVLLHDEKSVLACFCSMFLNTDTPIQREQYCDNVIQMIVGYCLCRSV